MKQTFITIAAFLLTSTVAQAQETDYLPLVREGVRWKYINCLTDEDYGVKKDTPYYYEFKGDSIINENIYKKCFVTLVEDDHSCTTELYCLMIEKDKQVYQRWLEDYYDEDELGLLIYDFKNVDGKNAGSVNIGGVKCKKYEMNDIPAWAYEPTPCDSYYLIEGIGVDLRGQFNWMGDLARPYMPACTTCLFSIKYRFSRLEDLNGKILYDAEDYHERMPGDCDFDSVVDINDVNIIIGYIIGSEGIIDNVKKHEWKLDVNDDDNIDTSDVNMVINAILGK